MFGYGLLNLRRSELYALDVSEFLDMIEGKLLWEERDLTFEAQKQDSTLDWIAWFAANIMQSSGNYKKNVDSLKLKEGLYQTEAERTANSAEVKQKDAAEEREKLMQRFNLDEESLTTK